MPLFQKRHYEWLAKWAASGSTQMPNWVIEHLTDALCEDNPRFNPDKFEHTIRDLIGGARTRDKS
ncbi:MAG TPA: hypothetical protein VD994_11535 [Prosthecobacter sp.]|nr:hypothetical protein [Prosthecobacter sp.]